jgi:hypothetical protein
MRVQGTKVAAGVAVTLGVLDKIKDNITAT